MYFSSMQFVCSLNLYLKYYNNQLLYRLNIPLKFQKQKLRLYGIGKKLTQEHKDIISKSNKGKIASDSLKKFRSDRMLNNNPSKGRFGINAINFKGYVKAYKQGVLYGIYDGVYAASRELNILPSNINRVILGKRKTSGGFTFIREIL